MAISLNFERKISMTQLRKSTKENPISQAEALEFMTKNPDAVFEVEKIGIAVELTKARGGEEVHTVTLARDGRTIDETKNTAAEGFAIDSRRCINGSKDQYAKKPAKAGPNNYTVDDGRTFDDLAVGETAKAHTVGGEVRKAFVAKEDMYLDTSWGEVQFVAKGGLVTFMGEEAIGNNNPCDLVIREDGKAASAVLTAPSYNIRKNYEATFGKKPEGAVDDFLKTAAEEDRKNPYLQRGLANNFQR